MIQLESPQPASGQEIPGDENDEINDFIIYDAVEDKLGNDATPTQYLQATPDFKQNSNFKNNLSSIKAQKDGCEVAVIKSEQHSQNQSNMDSSGNLGPN